MISKSRWIKAQKFEKIFWMRETIKKVKNEEIKRLYPFLKKFSYYISKKSKILDVGSGPTFLITFFKGKNMPLIL